jgi:hypothetical protein
LWSQQKTDTLHYSASIHFIVAQPDDYPNKTLTKMTAVLAITSKPAGKEGAGLRTQ